MRETQAPAPPAPFPFRIFGFDLRPETRAEPKPLISQPCTSNFKVRLIVNKEDDSRERILLDEASHAWIFGIDPPSLWSVETFSPLARGEW